MSDLENISIIIPVYNDSKVIDVTVREIVQEMSKISLGYSIVLVDDGSFDNSWQVILNLCQVYPKNIKGIKLSKNHGKDKAIYAGLSESLSELYLTIDADGEHPVNEIKNFINKYATDNCDIVYGIKLSRVNKHHGILSRLFNKIFKLLTHIDLTESSDYMLFNRKIRDVLLCSYDVDFFLEHL